MSTETNLPADPTPPAPVSPFAKHIALAKQLQTDCNPPGWPVLAVDPVVVALLYVGDQIAESSGTYMLHNIHDLICQINANRR